MVTGAIDAPPDFQECEKSREKEKTIMRNQRAILQFFNIRVIVYPGLVEIKGAIPTQILDKTKKEGNKTAQIITSPLLSLYFKGERVLPGKDYSPSGVGRENHGLSR